MDYDEARKALEKHRERKTWLEEAEKFLAEQSREREFTHENWSPRWGFTICVPDEMWRAQLQAQVEKIRSEVVDLDAKLRAYLGNPKIIA